MNEKYVKIFGWVGSILSLLMYVSYILQIIDNLHGRKGNWVQPAVACLNCLVWSIYGIGAKPRNWPLICANIPGIFLAAFASITSF